jgi:DDE superfamily endonuclease
MQSYCIPSALLPLLSTFAGCFTEPGFRHFVAVVTGWVLTRGPHRLTRVLRVARGLGYAAHHASYYRFLAAGRWTLDAVGGVLVRSLVPHLDQRILAIVDDTLCHKTGSQIFGTGVHHDGARSGYDRRGHRLTVFGFGHNWVVLALWVPCPWRRQRGFALPVLFRLCRQKARCPATLYHKRTDLAAELIAHLAALLPPDRHLVVVGDSAYCCKTVLRALPQRVSFVGPLPMKAALYETRSAQPATGRPRRKGYRLANPKTLAAQHSRWMRQAVDLHGRPVDIDVITLVCLWYPSAGHSPARIVLTRDPKRRAEMRAFVSTDPELDPATVLSLYSRRWQLEVTFRDMKQELGFEDPQNGFWRRRPGLRADTRRPMTKPRAHHGEPAVSRTAPLAGVAYTLTFLWYARRGQLDLDLARARELSPWHRHKTDVSFHDMRRALARQLLADLFRRTLSLARSHQNPPDLSAWEALAA